MLVSVAIPAYNQASYLREAIESAVAQTYRPLEIVVVDDGSTDDTPEVCLSYKEVNYIHQENDGTIGGGARIKVIREAKGEWIALLDQDDLWLPTKIERQIEVVRKQPRLGAVFTQTKYIDRSGKVLDQETVRGKSGHIFHDLLRGNLFYASSGMFRKTALDVCGYPDIDTLCDWDLWLRIVRYFDVYIIDDYMTQYRVHDGGFSSDRSEMIDRSLLLLSRQQTRLHEECAECEKSMSFIEKELLHQRANHHLSAFHTYIIGRQNKAACRHLAEVLKSEPGILFRDRKLYKVARSLASIPLRKFRNDSTEDA